MSYAIKFLFLLLNVMHRKTISATVSAVVYKVWQAKNNRFWNSKIHGIEITVKGSKIYCTVQINCIGQKISRDGAWIATL